MEAMSNIVNQSRELPDSLIRAGAGTSGKPSMPQMKRVIFEPGSLVEDCGYGWQTVPLNVRDLDTDTTCGTDYKIASHYGNYYGLPHKDYTIVPDELVEERGVNILVSKGMELKSKTYSKNGKVTVWKLISEKETFSMPEVEGMDNKNDVYQTGVVIYNSIMGGYALRGNFYCLRQICVNGLTGWGKDFGASIFHRGPQEKKMSKFDYVIEQINDFKNAMKQLFDSTVLYKVNKARMQYILDNAHIGTQLMPDWLEVNPKDYKITSMKPNAENKTLYEAINDITYKLSRADPKHPEHSKIKGQINFLGITQREQNIVRSVKDIIDNNGAVPLPRAR